MVTTITPFKDIQSLYTDMKDNYQSFTHSQHNDTIEMIPCYRVVEIKHGKLHFVSTKFGGSEMIITGNILYAELVHELFSQMSEYRLYIENRTEPLILLACKKR